jgi:GT2 family glycosyltransferase
MINVFAIIVTYNGSRWIDRALQSVLDSMIKVNVIIVDNHSQDDTCEKVRKSFPHVTLMKMHRNLGFGQGNNAGIKKAYDSKASHFFLLNQDAWVEPDSIEKLVSQQKENNGYGVLSPLHFTQEGDALDANFSSYINSSAYTDLYSDICLNKIKDTIYPTAFVNAAAWLLSRECVERVGGFSPSFFHYGEDDNYIQRVQYYGYKAGIYPLSRIYHARGNRNGTRYEEPLEKFKRIKLLKYSNPLLKHDINSDRRKLMMSCGWQLLQGRFDAFRSTQKQYKILKEIAPSVKENFLRSVQGKPLCFIEN